jgi:hypothetical protein
MEKHAGRKAGRCILSLLYKVEVGTERPLPTITRLLGI